VYHLIYSLSIEL